MLPPELLRNKMFTFTPVPVLYYRNQHSVSDIPNPINEAQRNRNCEEIITPFRGKTDLTCYFEHRYTKKRRNDGKMRKLTIKNVECDGILSIKNIYSYGKPK